MAEASLHKKLFVYHVLTPVCFHWTLRAKHQFLQDNFTQGGAVDVKVSHHRFGSASFHFLHRWLDRKTPNKQVLC